MQPGLTGTSARLEQGGSAAVGTAAMVAHGAGARGCGGSGGGRGGGGGGGGFDGKVTENKATRQPKIHKGQFRYNSGIRPLSPAKI